MEKTKTTWTKELEAKGHSVVKGSITATRVFKGSITATMNFEKEEVPYHDRSTHEDMIRTVSVHKVEAMFDGEVFYTETTPGLFKTEEEVLRAISAAEKDLNRFLFKLANSPEEKSFENTMRDLGYDTKNVSDDRN